MTETTEEQNSQKPRKPGGSGRGGFKPFTGKEGNTFSSTNQPSPELKSRGWRIRNAREELMERMCLSIVGDKKIEDAIYSAWQKAVNGDPSDFIKLMALAKPQDKQEIEVNDVTDRFALFQRKAEEWKKSHGNDDTE